MGRIILVTGKGGVGKSSIASAHALKLAREGKKTLLVSVDMAHNLGDIFGLETGGDVTDFEDIQPHLSILELDPDRLMREEFPDIRKAISSLMSGSGLAVHKERRPMMLPGFENLFCLLKIKTLYESGLYDWIIVDCAPTGETLSLLKLPELLTWYMEKFFPVGKMMVRVLSPISKIKYKTELPSAKAMDEIGQMHSQLVSLQEFLKDPAICSVRLVAIPEKMVVEETKRNYMYLNLYGYQVDRVFINRLLSEETGNDFMNHWGEIQKKYVMELHAVFRQVEVTELPWFEKELKGVEALDLMVQRFDAITAFFEFKQVVERDVYQAIDSGYELVVFVPGAKQEEMDVRLHELDVTIHMEDYVRCIPLPNALRGAMLQNTFCEEGMLHICFQCESL